MSNTQKDAEAGLCSDCCHGRTIFSDRGSAFVMCQLSASDPTFPKYPRLPVLLCAGYSRKAKPRTGPAAE